MPERCGKPYPWRPVPRERLRTERPEMAPRSRLDAHAAGIAAILSALGHPDRYGGDAGDAVETLLPFAVDVRRRSLVRELAERRGHPPEVVELACYLPPYRSVRLREGWEAWAAQQQTRRPARAADPLEERLRFNDA